MRAKGNIAMEETECLSLKIEQELDSKGTERLSQPLPGVFTRCDSNRAQRQERWSPKDTFTREKCLQSEN